MRNANKLTAAALFSLLALHAESLTSPIPGTAIPVNAWVKPRVRGYPASTTGYDKAEWVDALGCSMVWGGLYHFNNSEINTSMNCYTYAENRWNIMDDNGVWHSEHRGDGGHPNAQFTNMTLRNTLVWFGGNSSSNEPEVLYQTYWWDAVGRIGRAKWSGLSSNPKPLPFGTGNPGQNAIVYDPYVDKVFVFPDRLTSTSSYDPQTNLWTTLTTSGTAPTGTSFGSMRYNPTDHKLYYFGGSSSGYGSCGTTPSNTISVFDPSNNTWSTLATQGTPPPGRSGAGFAYSRVDNIFLVASGVICNGTTPTDATDTFVLDMNQSPPAWVQMTPNSNYVLSTAGGGSFNKLAYDSDNNVFVMMTKGDGATDYTSPWGQYATAVWVYAYSPAANYGRVTSTYMPSGTSLNRTTPQAADAESFAFDEAVAASGSTLFTGRIETSATFTGGTCLHHHPYVESRPLTGGAATPLGADCTAMDPEFGSTSDGSKLQLTVAGGGVLWACWEKSVAGGSHSSIWCKSWNGSSWNGAQIGVRNTAQPTQVYQGISSLFTVGATPTIAFIEWDKSQGYPHRAYAYVDQCTGSFPCTGLGGALNVNSGTPRTTAIAGASDGTNPWVCWTEEVDQTLSIITTTPQLYCAHWNGSAWSAASTLNVSSANWAADVSATYMNNALYVAWTEKTTAGNPLLYVASTNGLTKTLVGGAAINLDQTNGWPARPQLSNDGTNLDVCWEEQQNLNQPSRIYCKQWNGAAWISLGGALNVSTAYGAAQHNTLTVSGTTPVASWHETEPGTLAQAHAAYWNGSDWVGLTNGPQPLAVTASSLPASTAGASYSQSVAAWASGGTAPYGSWTIASGALPPGLSLNSATGLISGTASAAGTFSFTVRAADSASPAATATSGTTSITINPAAAITTTSPLPGGTTGTAYSQTLAATGGTAPLGWSLSAGTLPPGISLSASGILSGTPSQAGTFSFTVGVTDAANVSSTKAFQSTVTMPAGSVASFIMTGTASISGAASLR